MKERIRNSHGLLALIVVALMVVTITGPMRTFYYAAINPPVKSVYQLYHDAALVLEAQVVGRKENALMITPLKALKGKRRGAPNVILLEGSDCMDRFTVTESYVLFVSYDLDRGYWLGDCMATARNRKDPVDAEFLKALPKQVFRR